MGLNNTPMGERVHIGFFGRRNAGKSSLVNSITGQSLSVVSDVAGTTTDPVYKSMELLPIGPVVIIDTPGYDDVGDLGELRVERTTQVLNKTDIAVLVVEDRVGITGEDRVFIDLFKERNIKYIIAHNKCDESDACGQEDNELHIRVSAKSGFGIEELKELIGRLGITTAPARRLVGDFLEAGDTVLLVVPIDKAAPKGRLILPQQQAIRDILESGAKAVVCRDTELHETLKELKYKVKLVITDSQVFGQVKELVPESIYLTSFSILMARYKGVLKQAVEGAYVLDMIAKRSRFRSKILISEGCTHHRQCDDIGTVKLPDWIRKYTMTDPEFTFTSGGHFPDDLEAYNLIIHCGGCMLNEREMESRLQRARAAQVPMTNYGTAIAHMNGILERSLKVIRELDN